MAFLGRAEGVAVRFGYLQRAQGARRFLEVSDKDLTYLFIMVTETQTLEHTLWWRLPGPDEAPHRLVSPLSAAETCSWPLLWRAAPRETLPKTGC